LPLHGAGFWRGVTVVAAALLVAGCSLAGRGGPSIEGSRACTVVDSAFSASGLRDGLEVSGRTTIDVNQYRVNGRFQLRVSDTGDMILEFTSTSPMGGRREDVVFSYWQDTLRVFDREQGRFFEGDEVDELAEDGMGFEVNLAQVLRRVFLHPSDCDRFSDIRQSDDGRDLTGRVDGERFGLSFERGHIARADWPAPFSGAGASERLEVDYRWEGARLTGLTILAPVRRWRVRLDAED